jgi:hypothetical protein
MRKGKEKSAEITEDESVDEVGDKILNEDEIAEIKKAKKEEKEL